MRSGFACVTPRSSALGKTEFLTSIRGRVEWGTRLSPKQLCVLNAIFRKIERLTVPIGRTL
jgi:hypothetical protein